MTKQGEYSSQSVIALRFIEMLLHVKLNYFYRMIINRENRETNLNINVTTLFCYTQLKADDVIVYIILVLHTSNVVILYGSLFYTGNK